MSSKWVSFTRLTSSMYCKPVFYFYDFDENYPFDVWLEEMLNSLNGDYYYSEHHRGFDVEVVSKPPQDWIDKEILSVTQSIKYKQDYLDRLKQL